MSIKGMTMNTVLSVITWNNARYEQVYDDQLAVSLLAEEATEGFLALTDIELLDSIGDQLFVAIGVFWKADVFQRPYSQEALEYAILNCNPTIVEELFRFNIWSYPSEGREAALLTIKQCMNVMKAFNHQRALQHEHSSAEILLHDVLAAICISNNTKEIQLTESGVKANIVKGKGYVSPTENLKALLSGGSLTYNSSEDSK